MLVYRTTNRSLHVSIVRPLHLFSGELETFVNANAISHMRHVLRENGHPSKLINRVWNKILNPRNPEWKEQTTRSPYILLSFVQDLGNKIRRIVEPYYIKVYLIWKANALQECWVMANEHAPCQQRHGVYKIPCECGVMLHWSNKSTFSC